MIVEADHRLFRWIYAGEGAPGPLLRLMIALTLLGRGYSIVGIVPFVAHPVTRRPALYLAAVLVLLAGLELGIKLTFRRARPCDVLSGVRPLYGNPTGYSFPSGHATGSFAVACFVTGLAAIARGSSACPIVALACVSQLLALGISFSRVYLGAHYPSDVAAGALLGGSVALLGCHLYAS